MIDAALLYTHITAREMAEDTPAYLPTARSLAGDTGGVGGDSSTSGAGPTHNCVGEVLSEAPAGPAAAIVVAAASGDMSAAPSAEQQQQQPLQPMQPIQSVNSQQAAR